MPYGKGAFLYGKIYYYGAIYKAVPLSDKAAGLNQKGVTPAAININLPR